ncbi:MAG: hypothetical protein IJ094_12935 [Bacilli bacterium]|nr:hypothetical protein [Bacilli bacterium]
MENTKLIKFNQDDEIRNFLNRNDHLKHFINYDFLIIPLDKIMNIHIINEYDYTGLHIDIKKEESDYE